MVNLSTISSYLGLNRSSQSLSGGGKTSPNPAAVNAGRQTGEMFALAQG